MTVPLLELMKDTSGCDRTFKRYRISFPMLIRVAEEKTNTAMSEARGETLPGLAHNISLSGIGFVCGGRFDLQSLLEVEITLGDQAFPLLARVRWCQPLNIPDAALYHYGAQLLRTEAALAFIPFAAEFLLAHGSERVSNLKAGKTPSLTPGTSPVG